MVWISFFVLTLVMFFATASQNVSVGGTVGSIHKNAPYIIETFYAILSTMLLLLTTAFMNGTATRDFQYNMHQFIFTSPIKKRDYYFGKFFGAVIVSLVPMLGISAGALLAPILAPLFPASFDMVPPERFGPVIWSGHIDGLIVFAIPNVIISGVFLFSLAIIFRSNIVSFIGAMLILVLYLVSEGFTSDIKKEWLANLLDPFGVGPFETMTKYLTVSEKNNSGVGLEGNLLINRLVWLGISMVILLVVYYFFSFSTKKEKVKKQKGKKDVVTQQIIITDKVYTPTKANVFSLSTFLHLIKFEAKAIIKNPVFIILVAIAMILLITGLTSYTGRFGISQYPVTYDIVDTINGSFNFFMLAFIIFYTGVLVWKERDAKINEIQDATPIKTGVLFTSKVFAVIIALIIVYLCAILVGVIAQTAYGYTRYQLDVYVKSLLVIRLLGLSYYVVLSLLFHYLINNRYIAYFAFIAFFIIDSFIWGVLKIETNMVSFGSRPGIIYSDMNGFGPYVPSTMWFSIYWVLFCVLLSFIAIAFYVRGKEPLFKYRWKSAKRRFKNNSIAIVISCVAFISCACFVYYNTKVLNTYDSPDEQEDMQVSYEKKYKKYEGVAQPRFYKFNYTIDIFPETRDLTAKIEAWAVNRTESPISKLYVNVPTLTDSLKINVPGSKLSVNDKKLYFRIYTLDKPLAPNDSIKIDINFWKITQGFENNVTFTEVTQNGSFFNNMDISPTLGYNKDFEISDKNQRKKLKLPKRARMPKLDDNNLVARGNTYISNDSDWVEVNTTISTAADQIAVAPGSLLKSWKTNGRAHFNYKLDHKSLNFYSFVSARYEVARKKWKGIDLEVYYDKQHAYNVPNMLSSMQKSLEYYTTNFGPYMHKQCRIIEFPRYQSFAQAFPGTMPYGEGIGFITDLRNVTKNDIDQVFYVVAHEMGHQYWAHQVCGANMQGSEMMSEGFAQYSALMVMEKEYGKDKMKKFLQYEMDGYLGGRSTENEGEEPLMKTENQQYIHYEKASVIMYYLKEMIGENNVNHALQNLLKEYAYKNPPYATSIAAVKEFRAVTPDSLSYLIPDMFENITLFSNRMLNAKYKKVTAGYEVTLKTTSEKFRSDAVGKETSIPVNDYIDVAVFATPTDDENLGKVLAYKRVKISKKENTFTFTVKELPYQAGIDPYNYLIDRVPDDNVKIVD